MSPLLVACLAVGALTSAAHAVPASAAAGDSAAGQILHTANCTGCHDTGVYTRKDRKIGSLDRLKEQLQDCSHMIKKEFTPTEQENLVRFLNDRYYHFK